MKALPVFGCLCVAVCCSPVCCSVLQPTNPLCTNPYVRGLSRCLTKVVRNEGFAGIHIHAYGYMYIGICVYIYIYMRIYRGMSDCFTMVVRNEGFAGI